ncbi:MAG TPA: 3,4-dihydroxy-2-butanone-4-phosphate synthase [Solirubrobacteraceae bacterium]|nr:3,4-dihydroxy-2-butanone-4-phosphate synthase [Solirubrobacteraceae bacterium]
MNQIATRPPTALTAAVQRLASGAPGARAPGPPRRGPATLVYAAGLLTADRLASLLKQVPAPLRVAVTSRACQRLGLHDQVRLRSRVKTVATPRGHQEERLLNFVDARRGITTGVSAADRALTISLLASPRSSAADLVTPGHMLPVRAEAGEPTPAGRALALCEAAHLTACALLCPLLDEQGEPALDAALASASAALGAERILETEVDEAMDAAAAGGYWWS